MENDIQKKPNESFDSVIESLTDFVNCTLNLSESYLAIFLSKTDDYNTIDYEMHKHLMILHINGL